MMVFDVFFLYDLFVYCVFAAILKPVFAENYKLC